jgi:hexosaminidase
MKDKGRSYFEVNMRRRISRIWILSTLLILNRPTFAQPSLLPLPREVQWNNQRFLLKSCKAIIINDSSFLREAGRLKEMLAGNGFNIPVNFSATEKGLSINIKAGQVNNPQHSEDAYILKISADRVILTAHSAAGVFYALQTLRQLISGNGMITGCEIKDSPAFSWRGYMIDVGRNYMSVDLLKQQIDIMSRYKLNIFHFHFTEDIAWRLAIKQYPQLTAAETMIRNKGKYYSEADLKTLIAYCKERHILLVPEIDMPGHSAAFKRAMGFDMQSEAGLAALKNIIKEFIETYDLPYLHIGADEVKITNEKFIPEITDYITSFGKKVIGWQPGGNFKDNTIRQLWMETNTQVLAEKNIQYIDSRHLYINHMDPLEAVVTIFNRKIGDKEKGDDHLLGATLCTWHDRAVKDQEDILRMNPVYPAILAFAERTWCGGGTSGWTATIGEPASEEAKAFAAFEKRLLDHQQKYFSNLPFPYAKQSSLTWKLFGPYFNKGNLAAAFEPEKNHFNPNAAKPAMEVVGGTIIFRHWWYPLIKGALSQPEDSTTWYASTRIWSDEDAVKNFWIGFNNFSRSPATDSPPVGAWDDKKSAAWVNGNEIVPPKWKRGSGKGDSEIPLIDEGYEYREPTRVRLKKGWNTILIKAPVGSFKGSNWHNPVKWMFTFVPYQSEK